VTRIIGGTAGGRRLRTPRGAATRPTSDRVREALFSSVEAALGPLEGVAFLDLYAGSGAVGLEAASRGAARVTLVEQDRRTAGLVVANAREVDLDVEVRTSSVARFLAAWPAPAAYDVVFSDPPYALPDAEVRADLAALVENGWLADGALVVVERPARHPVGGWPAGLEPGRVRRYGETVLCFATRTPWYGPRDPDVEPDGGRPHDEEL
jgi:16S rRNA (guanine966-N2)-methyltransferase